MFIARGKEDALVTYNLVVGESVYGEKRISVEVLSNFCLLRVSDVKNLAVFIHICEFAVRKIHFAVCICMKHMSIHCVS